MNWAALPEQERLQESDDLLKQTILRLLFRNEALCPSMASVMLSVPLKRVVASFEKLKEEGKIRIDKRYSSTIDHNFPERNLWRLS